MTENGSTDLVWKWTNDTLDTTTFSTGANGTAITNLFDESDPNKSSNAPGSVTWMSRSDWTGTIPHRSRTADRQRDSGCKPRLHQVRRL